MSAPKHDDVLARLELLLASLRRGNDAVALGGCLVQLAELHGEREAPALAQPLFEEALATLRPTGKNGLIGRALFGLGVVEQSAERMAQAALAYQLANDALGEARARACLGEIWAFSGEPEKALPEYTRALSLFRQVSDEGQVAAALMSMGELHADRGDDAQARAAFAEALPIIHQRQDLLGQAICLLYLGETELRLRTARAALDHLSKAIVQLRAQGVVDLVPRALWQAGLAHAVLDEREQALEKYREAISHYTRLGALDEIGQLRDAIEALTPH